MNVHSMRASTSMGLPPAIPELVEPGYFVQPKSGTVHVLSLLCVDIRKDYTDYGGLEQSMELRAAYPPDGRRPRFRERLRIALAVLFGHYDWR